MSCSHWFVFCIIHWADNYAYGGVYGKLADDQSFCFNAIGLYTDYSCSVPVDVPRNQKRSRCPGNKQASKAGSPIHGTPKISTMLGNRCNFMGG